MRSSVSHYGQNKWFRQHRSNLMISPSLPQNVSVYKLQLCRWGQLNDHSLQVNSHRLPSCHCQWAPSDIMWKLIRCCRPRGPYNSVSYCSLALFPSVPPSARTSDGCCNDVSWPGGSFRVCCAWKERRKCGGRSWGGKWLRFCLISAPIHCEASGRNRHCRRQTAHPYRRHTSISDDTCTRTNTNTHAHFSHSFNINK